MTSVERILEYNNLETEADLKTSNPDTMKSLERYEGEIEFR